MPQLLFSINPPWYVPLNFKFVPENLIKFLMALAAKLRLVFKISTPVAGHFAKLYFHKYFHSQSFPHSLRNLQGVNILIFSQPGASFQP